MENIISDATRRNWGKLSVNIDDKLKSRANKQKSLKKIIPVEYLQDTDKINLIEKISETYTGAVTEAIYSIAVSLLQIEGIYERQSVQEILLAFQRENNIDLIPIDETIPRFNNKDDFLGALYQSFLTEGDKNKNGSYYTPRQIVNDMLYEFDLTEETTFLDPCCGSGAFLMGVRTNNPSNLFGIEKDPIAAFIAKVNLILSYKDINFKPQILCGDFLQDEVFFSSHDSFDFIATNPPWGNKTKIVSNLIDSKESFVHFFVKSYKLLKEGGRVNFLFPESILNVKSHKVIREFIISNHDLHEIHQYSSSFTGVVTNFISMNFIKGVKSNTVTIRNKNEEFNVEYTAFNHTENKVFSLLKPQEEQIVEKVLSRSAYSLSSSQWALGIVTGNNKEKLKSSDGPNLEKIYTGKEIDKFKLKEAKNYIYYDRDSFQQVAKDEIYRAKEKLVYKFVSNKLIFAYDDSSSLFLNSANILIPNIPGMSTKSVLAFLNSSLYQFLYEKLFGELKVLKGNLSELPFPKIDSKTNYELTKLVDEIIYEGKNNQKEIDEIVYRLFELD
ncbi:TaqI-like C-terminal specificity domain-containing protein [Streptococcus fryi]